MVPINDKGESKTANTETVLADVKEFILHDQSQISANQIFLNDSKEEFKKLDVNRFSIAQSDFFTAVIVIIIMYGIILFASSLRLKWIISFLIISLSLIDVWIVNYKIINPNKDKFRFSPLSNKKNLEVYFQKDEVIDFFSQDSSKYRISFILDSDAMRKAALSNRWVAFNIENAGGYHPAKLSIYDDELVHFLSLHTYLIDEEYKKKYGDSWQ